MESINPNGTKHHYEQGKIEGSWNRIFFASHCVAAFPIISQSTHALGARGIVHQ